MARQSGLEGTLPYPARWLAYLLLAGKDPASARDLFLTSLRINVETQDRTGCVASLVAVAAVHVAAGETGPATRLLRTAQTWLA